MRSVPKIRKLLVFVTAVIAFIAQVYGFAFAFVISALLLIWQIYEYNLPKMIFQKSQMQSSHWLEVGTHLRKNTALVCGMATIGTAMLQAMFLKVLDIIAFSKERTLVDTYIVVALISGFIWLIPEMINMWYFDSKLVSRFRDRKEENAIRKYAKAHSVFFRFATFLGFGGDFFVTLIILGISAFYFLNSLGRRRKMKTRIYDVIDKTEKTERSIWITWLRQDKTVVSHWLSLSLNASILILIFNSGLTNYNEPRQVLFLLLIGLCALFAYVGVKKGWKKWKYCILPISFMNLAFASALFDAFVMPINNLISSFAKTQIAILHATTVDEGVIAIIERSLLDSASFAAINLVVGFWVGYSLILIMGLFTVYADKAEKKRDYKAFTKTLRLFEVPALLFALDLFMLLLPNFVWGFGRQVSFVTVFLLTTAVSTGAVIAIELYLRKERSVFK